MTESTKARSLQISWIFLVLAVLGLIASAYAIHVHQVVEAGSSSACSVSAEVNCDTVIGSKYGVFLGLPLGVWGLVYFALVALTAVNDSKTAQALALRMRLGIAALGFAVVLGLAYISYGIIKVTCPVCATIHVLVLLLLVAALIEWWKWRKSTFAKGS